MNRRKWRKMGRASGHKRTRAVYKSGRKGVLLLWRCIEWQSGPNTWDTSCGLWDVGAKKWAAVEVYPWVAP